MRPSLLLASLVALAGCTLRPPLASEAVGCYAVQVDSFPQRFRDVLVPPLPELVELDTTLGGQLFVPRAWREADGLYVRRGYLQLMRPDLQIIGGTMVTGRARLGPLPPDSVVLVFRGAGVLSLQAHLGAAPSGDWRGQLFVPGSANLDELALVGMQMRRMSCDATPMATAGNVL